MIVVLTALEPDHAAVRAHLDGLRAHRHPAGTVFEVGHPRGRPDRPVALADVGTGTAALAVATERAVAEFAPAAVLVVGGARALRPWVRLGDVVVATEVLGPGGGTREAPHPLVQLAAHVNRTGAWPRPENLVGTIHFGPLAAGGGPPHVGDAVAEAVGDVVGIDQGPHSATPTLTILGVAAHADSPRAATDAEGWPGIAAANAAGFAVGLAAAVEPARPAATAPTPAPIVHNVASGNARVDAQIGVVHGGVVFGRREDDRP